MVIHGYIPSLQVKVILGPIERCQDWPTRRGRGREWEWGQAASRGRRSGYTSSSAMRTRTRTRPRSTSSSTTSTRQPCVMQRHAQCSRRLHCTRVSTWLRPSIVFTRRCCGRPRKLPRVSTRIATRQQRRRAVVPMLVLVRKSCQARADTRGCPRPGDLRALRRGDRRVERCHFSDWSCSWCERSWRMRR